MKGPGKVAARVAAVTLVVAKALVLA